MNTRKALPITTVLLILALALATVGVGYGLWSKVLTIKGTVETGEVNAIFSIEEVDQGWAGFLVDDGVWENHEWENKDVANCIASLVEKSPPDLNNEGPQLMTITITNGYPSFSCYVNFNVENVGSIPIKLEQPHLTGVDPVALDVDFLTGNEGTAGCYFAEENGSAVGPVVAHPQLEPEEATFCTIRVHVLQQAEQDQVGEDAYTFTASICVHQWNEEPGDPVACTPAD